MRSTALNSSRLLLTFWPRLCLWHLSLRNLYASIMATVNSLYLVPGHSI